MMWLLQVEELQNLVLKVEPKFYKGAGQPMNGGAAGCAGQPSEWGGGRVCGEAK